MPKKGEASREAILRTSRAIILEEGIEKLAHGAIAARLGLSKSAVLYHYSSKRALWEALIAQYVGHLSEEEARHEAPYIASGLSPEEAILPAMRDWFMDFSRNAEGWVEIGSALIGLHQNDKALLEPIRGWYRDLYGRIAQSGLPREKAFAAMMTFDGLFNSMKLGLFVLDRDAAERISRQVLEDLFKDQPGKLAKIEAVHQCFLNQAAPYANE